MKEQHFRTLGWGWVAVVSLVAASWVLYVHDRYGQLSFVWDYINPIWDWLAFMGIVNLFNFAGAKFAADCWYKKEPTTGERSFMIKAAIIIQSTMLYIFYRWLSAMFDQSL